MKRLYISHSLTSKCSSNVFLQYGLVGLVEEGKTLVCSQTTMISGAWPPPAPSVWYVCIVLPLNAPIVPRFIFKKIKC